MGKGLHILNIGIRAQKRPAAVSADSISVSPGQLAFYADGTPQSSTSTYVTASGSWTSETLDTGSGIFFSCSPTSYRTSTTVTIYVDYNDMLIYRTGRIRFWRGTAYADLDIEQYAY
jgi:hypothetical protein